MTNRKNWKIVVAALAVVALFAAGCVSGKSGAAGGLAQVENDVGGAGGSLSGGEWTTVPLSKNAGKASQNGRKAADIVLPENGFLLSLAENPSAGFTWRYKIADPAMIAVSEDFYEADDAPAGVVGYGGTRNIVFVCKKDGKSSIELVYCRPWQGGETAERRVVNVSYQKGVALSWEMERLGSME